MKSTCKTCFVWLRKQSAYTGKRNIKVSITNVVIAKKFWKLGQNVKVKITRCTYVFNMIKYWKEANTISIKIIQYKKLTNCPRYVIWDLNSVFKNLFAWMIYNFISCILQVVIIYCDKYFHEPDFTTFKNKHLITRFWDKLK